MGDWELGMRERLLQRPPFFFSAHQFSGNPIKFTVNATTTTNRRMLFCMTDFTQEFNEASKNKVRMRIFFSNQVETYVEQHSVIE